MADEEHKKSALGSAANAASSGKKAYDAAKAIATAAKAGKAASAAAIGSATAGVGALVVLAWENREFLLKTVGMILALNLLAVIIVVRLISWLPAIIFGSGNNGYKDIGNINSILQDVDSYKASVQDAISQEHNDVIQKIKDDAQKNGYTPVPAQQDAAQNSSAASSSGTSSSSSSSGDDTGTQMEYQINDNFISVSDQAVYLAVSAYSIKNGDNQDADSSKFAATVKDAFTKCFTYTKSDPANSSGSSSSGNTDSGQMIVTYTVTYHESDIEDAFGLTATQKTQAEAKANSMADFVQQTILDAPAGGSGYSGITSDALLQFIIRHEGFSDVPYTGVDVQNRTIGFGHVIQPGENLTYLTPDQALSLLESDLKVYEDSVNKEFADVKLTQYQHDALVSFSYNLGAYIWPQASTLVSDIKANASADVLKQDFGAFCHCNGQVIPGLVTRRLDEWKLYTTGDYGNS